MTAQAGGDGGNGGDGGFGGGAGAGGGGLTWRATDCATSAMGCA